jgi:hypothetical protein
MNYASVYTNTHSSHLYIDDRCDQVIPPWSCEPGASVDQSQHVKADQNICEEVLKGGEVYSARGEKGRSGARASDE